MRPGQRGFAVRMDWGLEGADAVLTGTDVAVVVDVLSFTTTLTVAVEAGITVWPYRWDDRSAMTFAARRRAVLAVGRKAARPGQVSLSPATIAGAVGVTRLVLPSPNGSTISARLAASGVEVLAASLRNAAAVARWIGRPGPPEQEQEQVVAVIAAGERWAQGGLRPAVEDLWGAGALIAHLQELGWTGLSPEARAAADAYRGARSALPELMMTCASGQELVDLGFGDDVRVAAAVGASDAVPRLDGDCFRSADRHQPRPSAKDRPR
jgi:2-phosphosulfolactate phosphatase